LISRFFNHVIRRMRRAKDSSTDFFRRNRSPALALQRASDVNQEIAMTFMGPFVNRLSVVTAYLAFALVGAIVLGVF
jgi:NADH:ubiquinone oxidoreductase subunit 6 (subunit J)